MGHCHQAVALSVGQVYGVIGDFTADEFFQTAGYAADAVVDVGEVQYFVFAVDGDGAFGIDFADEMGDDA